MASTITRIVCQRIYQIPVMVLCLLVMVIQMVVLDYYLVEGMGSPLWWLWIIPDILVLAIFLLAFILSYKFLKKPARRRPAKAPQGGELPLGYIAWGLYSVFLATKVAIIFVRFASYLAEEDFFGPNTLKTAIALSSAVFLMLVMTHHDAEENSSRHFYIDVMIGGVTMDLLDTVAFLEPIFTAESRIFLTFHMHYTIVAIGVMNLILPTLPLLILSRTQFGRGYLPRLLYTIHITVYLCVINIPLLVIRLMLWHVHDQNISVFLMKNVLALGLAIKKIHASAMKMNEDAVDGVARGATKTEGVGLKAEGAKLEEIEMEVHKEPGAEGNTPTTEL